MKAIFLFALVAIFVVPSFFNSYQQESRRSEQSAVLVELESLNHPAVSKLVNEWRLYYPSPTSERLAELKVLAQRIKNDPASAEKFSAAEKQKQLDELPFEPVFGSFRAKPGI